HTPHHGREERRRRVVRRESLLGGEPGTPREQRRQPGAALRRELHGIPAISRVQEGLPATPREVARADGPVTVEVRCERSPQDAGRLQNMLGSDAPAASRTAPASTPLSTSSPSRYHVPSLEPSISAPASGVTLNAQPHVQHPWTFTC